jgi:hypothetical protein
MNVTVRSITFLCLLLRLTLTITPVRAQQQPDSTVIDQTSAFNHSVLQRLGPDSRLYNGHEYIGHGALAQGFPLFETDTFAMGSLSYDGALYSNIPMEYDLVLDEVVISDYTGKSLISLIDNKVNYFSFGAHRFRFLDPEHSGLLLPKAGFYEELYSAPSLTLLARREKRLLFPSNAEDLAKYIQVNTWFLVIGGRTFKVDNETALLEALHDKKSLLKKYIQSNSLRFKKQFEKALIQTVTYYHQLGP